MDGKGFATDGKAKQVRPTCRDASAFRAEKSCPPAAAMSAIDAVDGSSTGT